MRQEMGIPVAALEDDLPAHQPDYADVLAALGPPASISALDSGMVFQYEYTQVREAQFGISLNYSWLKLFKFVLARGWNERKVLVLLFDEEGRLASHESGSWKVNLGGGSGVQPVFVVNSLVDTSQAESTYPSHEWGAALLNPRLPEALNRNQSPGSGLAGVEQGGTPMGVGQRALEQR